MTITILIPVKDPKNLIGGVKQIINNIENCNYPKGKIEIVFLIVSPEDKGLRTFNGLPIVKVRYYKEYIEALNDGIQKALGDVLVICDIETRFIPGRLTTVVQSLEQAKDRMVFFDKDWVAMRLLKFMFPGDLICLRTHILLFEFIHQRNVIGDYGKIHRKEALRFMYKMEKIKLRDKLKILWGCR